MPRVPPGWPTISLPHRLANIHSCSRSPAWPNGASRLCGTPVPKPSSEMEKFWTRVRDMNRSWLPHCHGVQCHSPRNEGLTQPIGCYTFIATKQLR